jgi:predicted nicotinamide N-methyase
VLAGDTFYDPKVAARVLPFLDRCLEAGIEVLVGDPNRADLPRDRLTQIAAYDVPEVGGGRDKALTAAFVYRLEPRSG